MDGLFNVGKIFVVIKNKTNFKVSSIIVVQGKKVNFFLYLPGTCKGKKNNKNTRGRIPICMKRELD